MRPNYRYKMVMLCAELEKLNLIEQTLNDIFLFKLINEQWFWWGEIWRNSAISSARKERLLQVCLANTFSPFFFEFLQTVVKNADTRWYPNIIDSLLAEIKRKLDCEYIGIFTPQILSGAMVANITAQASKRLGKKVYAYQSIDPKLMDGFRLSFQGKMIDLSGRHILDTLANYLEGSET